jgi:hypothetical protein
MCLNNGRDIYDEYNLPRSKCRITSPATIKYNSVAWSAGEDGRNWQPLLMGGYYWPNDIAKEFTLSAFISLYRSLGFEQVPGIPCEYEEGIERIAIYVGKDNRPSHVARQITNEMIDSYPSHPEFRQTRGQWTSKIFDQEDICHDSINDLEQSNQIGRAVVIMIRRSTV